MKRFTIVANWKANKTVTEMEEWVKVVAENYAPKDNLEIVLCPPFNLLYPLKLSLAKYQLTMELGAQDVSSFPEGAYTGEVSARMLKDLDAEYVLVGHSERRRYFGETDAQVVKKVQMALDFQITPIACISELSQITHILSELKTLDLGKIVFMFEPAEAISLQVGSIGQGEAEPVSEVAEMIKKMKELTPQSKFFYGGSVKSHNIAGFLSQPEIDGIVAGTASQNAPEFIRMIQNAV